MKNFKELLIWKKGIELVKQVYKLVLLFPKEEKFGLTSQITRAAVSIPANIAEGSSRDSDKDYARFLQIALGSSFEVQTYLIIAREMNLVGSEELDKVETLLEEEIKMIHGFLRTLKQANS